MLPFILIIILIILVISNIKIVPQAYAYIVERLGAYNATWSTGLHFKIPIIDRVAKKISLKEIVADFPPQPVITKDNADRHGNIFAGNRSQALYLRRRQSHESHRKPYGHNT